MPWDPSAPPRRIVSLVPSITESLFALGLGDRLVAVTQWCVHPADGVAELPKVGGTKNPDLAAITALVPELVIANHEENTHRAVTRLEAAGVPVWVTYPRRVRDGARLLAELAQLGGESGRERCARVVEEVAAELEAAEQRLAERSAGAAASAPRIFCPIWRDPWMTVGRDTYVHDMLELCGGANVFADAGDRRYPVVDVEVIVASAPDIVLLPDEPYAFGPEERRELEALALPAARSGRIHLIDGTWVSWYGPRIGPAIRVLGGLIADRPAGRTRPAAQSRRQSG
ncbi:MAG: ABC transporter substrate-binding protein [Deltaproteobacteria bacterium]|nr:ABC transporter substrate-binding protein [Deltaproteobacteria bacterium]MBW2418826.1 ABC transporter substrate-binding protein [Deltaproteobacteria bacterium]